MRLVLAGDVMLGRLVNDALRQVPPSYVWGDVLPHLLAADGRIVNLECVISDRGAPEPGKTFTFRSDAKNIAALTAARITAVSLANNHALDYGPDALVECLALLREHGVATAGAGGSLDEARRPAVLLVGGVTLALVACTDNMPEWEANEQPGVFFVPDRVSDPRFGALRRIVADAKAQADLVVVSFHWGPNWGRRPLPEQVAVARALAEAGADVVFGHSPHIFRGVALAGGALILYSAGDLLDDYAVDAVERNDWSFLFALDYDGARLGRVTMLPTVAREFQARLAQGRERQRIVERMRQRCEALGTACEVTDDGLVVAGP